MAAPLKMTPEAQPEASLEGAGGAAIEGRSLGRIAWMRLRRDRVAMASGSYIVFLFLVAITAFVLSLGAPESPPPAVPSASNGSKYVEVVSKTDVEMPKLMVPLEVPKK